MFRSSSGFSLLELLLTVALSVGLVAACLQGYTSFYQHQQAVNAQLTMMQQGLLALSSIRQTVLNAGLQGCRRILALPSVTGTADHLHIHTVAPSYDTLLSDAFSDQLMVTNRQHFRSGQSIILNDCSHAVLATIVAVTKQGEQQQLQLAAPLPAPFLAGTEVSQWQHWQYYVNVTGQGNKALYLKEGEHPAQAVVDGIESIGLQYGGVLEGKQQFYQQAQGLGFAITWLRVAVTSKESNRQKDFQLDIGIRNG